MKLLSIIALALSFTACSSKEITPREPASQTIDQNSSNISLIQVAMIDSKKQALYIVQDATLNRFTIAECTNSDKSAGKTLMNKNINCETLTDMWVPNQSNLSNQSDFDKTFDENYNLSLKIQSKLLRQNWKWFGSVQNVLTAAAVGYGGTYMIARYLRPQYLINKGYVANPVTMAFGTVLTVVTMVGEELIGYANRNAHSIEALMFNLYPNAPAAERNAAAPVVYEAIKASLLFAVNARRLALQ